MKKIGLMLGTLLVLTCASAQNNQYYEKMGQSMQGFATCSTVEDFQHLANQFKVIANVEKEEWLPLYYEAQCYILMSFTGTLEAARRDSYLETASGLVDRMSEMAPGEAEVAVMEAFYLTGYLVVDPPQRAMNTSPQIHAAIARALSIEPRNPRARFLRISNEMGTASFFGEDISAYCEEASKLLEDWDSYEPKSPIHPSWGKNETEGIVRECGK